MACTLVDRKTGDTVLIASVIKRGGADDTAETRREMAPAKPGRDNGSPVHLRGMTTPATVLLAQDDPSASPEFNIWATTKNSYMWIIYTPPNIAIKDAIASQGPPISMLIKDADTNLENILSEHESSGSSPSS